MAITHDIELKSGKYPAAYHAIVELRQTDRWSNLQRQMAPDQRPAKYGLQVFTDIWASEEARIKGEPPISRRVDRGAVEAGKDVWAEGYRILGDALMGKYPDSERTKRIKQHTETMHAFVKAPEEFRFLKLRGEEKKVTPSDAMMLLKILPIAESDGQAEGKFFFDEAPMVLTLDEINDLFGQLAGEPAAIKAPPLEPTAADHFADLMLADETVEDAKERLSLELKELRHVLMTPSLQVNEDGSTGLTTEDQTRLQDLERRQALGRWLDA